MADDTPSDTPSTTPLDESLDKLLGIKKKETNPIGYDPTATFRPTGDTITVAGVPATGATTAESWSHDVALENLKQQALQNEFQQRQTEQEFAYKQQQQDIENQRQAAQLAITQGQFGLSKETQLGQLAIQQAADTRAAQQAALQAQETRQAMDIKAATEARARADEMVKYGGYTGAQVPALYARNADYTAFRGGPSVPITADTGRAYAAYVAAQNIAPNTNTGGLQPNVYNPIQKNPADTGFHYLGGPGMPSLVYR